MKSIARCMVIPIVYVDDITVYGSDLIGIEEVKYVLEEVVSD